MSFSRGLRSDLASPVAHDAARIDFRVTAHEELHHLRLPLRGGPHQRRLIAPLLARIHMRTGPHEELRRLDVTGAGDRHQGRLAFGVRGVGVGAAP